jgi:hypothetical protein
MKQLCLLREEFRSDWTFLKLTEDSAGGLNPERIAIHQPSVDAPAATLGEHPKPIHQL